MSSSVVVGRDPACPIVVADESVSRRHAELTLTKDGKLYVTDCKSRNGTFEVIDGEPRRITQGVVGTDSIIRFGECDLPVAEILRLVQDAAKIHGGPATRSAKHIRCTCGAVRREREKCSVCGAATRGVKR